MLDDPNVYFKLDYRAVQCEICASEFQLKDKVRAKTQDDFYVMKWLVHDKCLNSDIGKQELLENERQQYKLVKELVHIRKVGEGQQQLIFENID